MALKLPVYSQPQVADRAAPNVQNNTAVPNMGEGLVKAMGAGLQVLDTEVQRANESRILGFENKLKMQLTQYEAQLKGLRGENALKVGGDGLNEFDRVHDNFLKFADSELKNLTPYQQSQATKIKDSLSISLNRSISAHQLAAQDAYDKQGLDTGLGLALNDMTKAVENGVYNPEVRQKAVEKVNSLLDRAAPLYGWDADTRKLQGLERLSKGNRSIVESLAKSNSQNAIKYFEEHKDEFTPDDRKAVVALTAAAATKDIAFAKSDYLWNKYAPKSDDINTAVQLEAMKNEARQDPVLRENHEARQLVLADLTERAGTHEHTTGRVKDQYVGTVYSTFQQAGYRAAIKSDEFEKLDGKTQTVIKSSLLGVIRAQQEQKTDAQRAAEFGRFWDFTHSQEFLTTPSRDILAKSGKDFSYELAVRALQMQDELKNKPEKVFSVTTDREDFNLLAGKAGLPVHTTPAQLSDSDRTKLDSLKYQWENEIDRQQTSTGKLLNRKEKQDILKQLLTPMPFFDKTWYGGVTVSEAPMFEVPDAANKVSQVMTADRAGFQATLDYLDANGINPVLLSKSELLRIYTQIRAKRTGK